MSVVEVGTDKPGWIGLRAEALGAAARDVEPCSPITLTEQ